MRILFILDYGNPLYDKGMAPSSEEGRAAFARWAASAAQHFAGQGILWEMWNEPDGEFWKPRPKVADYVKLALATGQAIREAAPGETFIGPATSGGLNFPFLETCFQAGLLDYWAGVSVHLYRRSDPETASVELRRLRLLIARYAPPGKRVPIISGEWGYSAEMAGNSAQKVGWMLPRMWLSNIANEVPLSIWYDWHDDWTDPKKPDSGNAFGVVSKAYYEKRDPVFDPKPAYVAARPLTTQLNGFAFNKRLSLSDDRDYALLFTRGDEVRLAVWTTATEPRPVVIPASSGRFRVTSYLGDAPTEISARDAGLPITLSDKPQYLAPLAPNDLLSVAAAWERLPLEITTNAPAQVKLTHRFKNPLRRAIQILGGGPQPINLNPGASAPLVLSWPVQQNAEPKLLRVELKLPGLGTLAQTTQIAVTNLLQLTVLPRSGNVLPVRVENPSGTAFNGSVTTAIGLGAEKRALTLPLTIGAGQTEKIVAVPLQNEGDVLRASVQVQVQVLDAKGASVVSIAATEFRQVEDFARYAAGPLPFKVAQSGGPELVQETLSIASPPDSPSPAGGSLKLPYRFEQGLKYVSVVPTSDATRIIEGRPNSLGVWVWGDGSGHATRMRVSDASGQTFQFSSENIDWQGWRYITFRFDPAAAHWGGAKDGIFHLPLRLDSMFLLDDVGHKSQGAIYLSAPTLMY